MKRGIWATLLFALTAALTACSGRSDAPKLLDREGIAPYELSESETYILQSFNMDGTSQIVSFHAPKEALTLQVNAYRLEENERWVNIDGSGVSVSIGTSMRSYSLDDYDEPSKFAGMDLVQFVTLEFSDK